MNPEEIRLALQIMNLGFSTLASYNISEQAYIKLRQDLGRPLTFDDLEPLFQTARQHIDEIGTPHG